MKQKFSIFFDQTFLKFLLVGVANTVVGTAVMFLCYNWLSLSYWISSAMNYIVGSVLSYFLNKTFTFEQKKSSVKMVGRFVANISICYGLAYGIARPATRWVLSSASISVQDNLAMMVGMGLFVVLNYIGQRFWAFKDE